MNSSLHAPGQVISFYSYKGGVGRTMAVANVGRLLADQASRTGQRVLLIDWDLEAPGLQEYFPRCVADSHVGLIDFFAQNYPDCVREPQTDVKSTVTLEDSIVSMVNGLDILPAGRQDLRYAGLVWNFDWSKLVRLHPNVFKDFRERLTERYAFVLIDSRTGVSDISGISTGVLPDKLVTLFSPNNQGLKGLGRVITQVLSYRRTSSDERPLTVFPVPSRFDGADPGHLSYLVEFQDMFVELFKVHYGLESVDLRDYLKETLLPFVPHYSSGEPIAVGRQDPDHPGSLRAAYTRLANRLQRHVPWRDADELA